MTHSLTSRWSGWKSSRCLRGREGERVTPKTTHCQPEYSSILEKSKPLPLDANTKRELPHVSKHPNTHIDTQTVYNSLSCLPFLLKADCYPLRQCLDGRRSLRVQNKNSLNGAI